MANNSYYAKHLRRQTRIIWTTDPPRNPSNPPAPGTWVEYSLKRFKGLGDRVVAIKNLYRALRGHIWIHQVGGKAIQVFHLAIPEVFRAELQWEVYNQTRFIPEELTAWDLFKEQPALGGKAWGMIEASPLVRGRRIENSLSTLDQVGLISVRKGGAFVVHYQGPFWSSLYRISQKDLS